MNTLYENPLPILAVGAVLATLCGLMFLTRRSLKSLLAFAGVLVVTLILLCVETWVVTPREEVELAMESLVRVVEADNLPEVLRLIDPAATELRKEFEMLMPTVTVEAANASAVKIELDSETSAKLHCQGMLRAMHRSSASFFAVVKLDVFWVKREGLWLMSGYTAYNKDGKAVKSISSLRK